jgi:CRP/FNR family transcriptional regulator, cyclic AMP receptor protein
MYGLTAYGLNAQSFMRYWDHPSAGDWAQVLGTFPLFSGISKRRLRKLVQHARVKEYAPGDIVVETDTPGDSLYVILSGTAKALGKPAARTLRTGDYFGELGVFDGVPRSATVIATHELHVMKLRRQAFLRLAKRDPAISLTMLRNLTAQFRRLEAQAAQR